MALVRKDRLTIIGQEAFDMLDELYVKPKRRSNYPNNNSKFSSSHQLPQDHLRFRQPADRLTTIGQDAFEMLDELYVKPKRRSNYPNNKSKFSSSHQVHVHQDQYLRFDQPNYQQNQQAYVYHGPRVDMVKEAVNSSTSSNSYVYQGPQISTVRDPVWPNSMESVRCPSLGQNNKVSPSMSDRVISSDEAAKIYKGIMTKEY